MHSRASSAASARGAERPRARRPARAARRRRRRGREGAECRRCAGRGGCAPRSSNSSKIGTTEPKAKAPTATHFHGAEGALEEPVDLVRQVAVPYHQHGHEIDVGDAQVSPRASARRGRAPIALLSAGAKSAAKASAASNCMMAMLAPNEVDMNAGSAATGSSRPTSGSRSRRGRRAPNGGEQHAGASADAAAARSASMLQTDEGDDRRAE